MELNVNTNPEKKPTNKHDLRCDASLITAPAYTQADLSVSSECARLMTVETHSNIFECRCSVIAQGLMETFHCKLFYIFVANLAAKPFSFPNFMIGPFVVFAPACTIHARDDDQYMLKNGGQRLDAMGQ